MTKKKLLIAMITLVVLLLSTLADMAPMSRDEWERHRQFLESFTTHLHSISILSPLITASSIFAGYVLAILAGVIFEFVLTALLKRYSRNWDALRRGWIVTTISISIVVSLAMVNFWFQPLASFFDRVSGADRVTVAEESYEDYLFYRNHCRKCGSALEYDMGRYCPKCNPREVPSASKITFDVENRIK